MMMDVDIMMMIKMMMIYWCRKSASARFTNVIIKISFGHGVMNLIHF